MRKAIVAAIAKSLREFGYPDADAAKIEDVRKAFRDGKRGEDLPHGILGRFAESQLAECDETHPGWDKQ